MAAADRWSRCLFPAARPSCCSRRNRCIPCRTSARPRSISRASNSRMDFRSSALASLLALAAATLLAPGVAHAQREFRVYPSFEGEDAEAPLPPDWNVPGELVIGRLMYPGPGFGFFGGD